MILAQKLKRYLLTSLLFVVFWFQKGTAQTVNNEKLFVADEGEFHVPVGTYTFGNSPASTATTKGDTNYGVVSFASGVTWTGASDTHYLNGYARYYGDDFFIAPVGDSNTLAPAAVDADSTTGVDIGYFKAAPTALGTGLGIGIESISGVEYWKIKGTGNAKVTLTWRASSNLDDVLLTPSLTYITIVGFNGTEWVEIPSFYDITSVLGGTSDISQGSITSTDVVSIAGYEAFALGVKGSPSCYPVVISSGNTKTWNGSSWTPNAPSINDPVVIDQPYSAGSFSAYSVAMNADITLNDGETIDVADNFTGSSRVIMSSEASVLQRNSTASAPKILMTKITNPMRRFDYVFLSSPLNDFATFFNQINSASHSAVEGQFNTYSHPAFYYYLTDSSSGGNAVVTSSNVPLGKGFSATVRYTQAPYTVSAVPGSWNDEKFPIHVKAEGTTNNGNIVIPMPSGAGWTRIGNPYPSPINANKLLDVLGENIRKTIYYWTFNTPRVNFEANSLNYNNADYAVFNYSGGVAACSGCQEPNGMISTMQSVYVRKIWTSPINFTMTNCLRDLSGNDVFFRNSTDSTGKFRLNFTGTSGSFSQVLVAYNPATTVDYDNGYDSVRMSSGITSEFNTLIAGQTAGYAIQTRGGFDVADVVPVQVLKRIEESFTITLASKEGVFATGDVPIYLYDKTLNVFHDFSRGGYSFMQADTTDNSRFEIVYQNSTLGNYEVTKNNAVAYINNQTFSAQASSSMSEIHLFDLTGRLIQSFTDINSSSLSRPFNYPQSVYIAKIKLEDGTLVNKKVINN